VGYQEVKSFGEATILDGGYPFSTRGTGHYRMVSPQIIVVVHIEITIIVVLAGV
jgi:hypothetical protein